MTDLITQIRAIPAQNSLSFLESVFSSYDTHQVFAVARDGIDLKALGVPVVLEELTAVERGWGRFAHVPQNRPDPAQIVFTSGTEGQPKPIVLSHANLADVVTRLNDVMQVTDEIREYIGVPVTYSFGLGRARAVAAAGGALYLPERFDPLEIRDMLAAGEINAISAVPSLWQAVLAVPDIFADVGSRVRWIEIGSQYMSAADKAAMVRLFPKARIVQHYGLTEASRSTFLVISDAEQDVLESVGMAQGAVEIRISDGEAIAIRGHHVALGQMKPGGEVAPLTDAEGWFETSDRGALRDGALYYLGRLDDQINVAGIKLAAEALESEIAGLIPGAVGQFAITGVPDAARGEAVLMAIEAGAEPQHSLIIEAARVALDRRGISAGALKTKVLTSLPRTETNKIRRRDIAEAFSETTNEATASQEAENLSPEAERVAASWRKVIPGAQIGAHQSFYDLGGDSLSSVQVGMVMESDGFDRASVRATLAGQTLSDVVAITTSPEIETSATELSERTVKNWGISLTRGVMVLSVLLSHWGPGVFARLGMEAPAETVLSFLYRMGTPGFALVFGIGIGAFMLPDFASNRAGVLRRMRASLKLVAAGLAAIAITKLVGLWLKGEPLTALRWANAFYGVLGYYIVMLAAAPLWLPALARLRAPMVGLVLAAPVFWALWQIAGTVIPGAQLQSLLEWPRLMLTAGYNIFKMTALAAAGAAIGYWFAAQKDVAAASRHLILFGGVLTTLAAFSVMQAYGLEALSTRSSKAFTTLPGLAFYTGISALMLGLFSWALMGWQHRRGLLRLGLEILLVIGGLALQIYVYHGLVLPVRGILASLGLPGIVALGVPMGCFLLWLVVAGRRLHRMYV